jgi:hypothetical protein
MHTGSKGWFVEQLKRHGITYYEGRKLERYKTSRLANLLEEKKR